MAILVMLLRENKFSLKNLKYFLLITLSSVIRDMGFEYVVSVWLQSIIVFALFIQ